MRAFPNQVGCQSHHLCFNSFFFSSPLLSSLLEDYLIFLQFYRLGCHRFFAYHFFNSFSFIFLLFNLIIFLIQIIFLMKFDTPGPGGNYRVPSLADPDKKDATKT
jgi:hypothetical protein